MTGPDPSEIAYDALIIGSGISGLSAAQTMARQLHTALIFTAGTHRDWPSTHIQNVLTIEGRHPEDFRAAAKKELLQGCLNFHAKTFLFRSFLFLFMHIPRPSAAVPAVLRKEKYGVDSVRLRVGTRTFLNLGGEAKLKVTN